MWAGSSVVTLDSSCGCNEIFCAMGFSFGAVAAEFVVVVVPECFTGLPEGGADACPCACGPAYAGANVKQAAAAKPRIVRVCRIHVASKDGSGAKLVPAGLREIGLKSAL